MMKHAFVATNVTSLTRLDIVQVRAITVSICCHMPTPFFAMKPAFVATNVTSPTRLGIVLVSAVRHVTLVERSDHIRVGNPVGM